MKPIIVSAISFLLLSGCTFSADSYFVRWWNGNLPMSDGERKAWSYCLRESKLRYPDSIDHVEKERIKYRKECMKKKRYF